MSDSLPERPDLGQLRRRAKELRDAARSGDAVAVQRFARHHPSARNDAVSLAAASWSSPASWVSRAGPGSKPPSPPCEASKSTATPSCSGSPWPNRQKEPDPRRHSSSTRSSPSTAPRSSTSRAPQTAAAHSPAREARARGTPRSWQVTTGSRPRRAQPRRRRQAGRWSGGLITAAGRLTGDVKRDGGAGLREQETVEPADGEAGPLDRRGGVAAEVAAADQVRPYRGVEGALDAGQPGGVSTDVFEEAQHAAGLEHAADLPQCRGLVGDR